MFINFRERGGETERHSGVKKKHGSDASHMQPGLGSNPQPRYVSWPGIKPTTFWLQPTEPHSQGYKENFDEHKGRDQQ